MPTKKEIVVELYQQGITTVKEIVQKTGFLRATVKNYVRQLRYPEKSELMRQQIRQAVDKNNVVTLSLAKHHRQEWTLVEIKYIEENAGKKSALQIAKNLGRTYSSTFSSAHKFGILLRRNKFKNVEAKNHPREWTLQEIEYLKEHGQEQSARQIAETLNRTYLSIRMAARRFSIDICGNKIGAGSKKFVGTYQKPEENLIDTKIV